MRKGVKMAQSDSGDQVLSPRKTRLTMRQNAEAIETLRQEMKDDRKTADERFNQMMNAIGAIPGGAGRDVGRDADRPNNMAAIPVTAGGDQQGAWREPCTRPSGHGRLDNDTLPGTG